MSDKKPKPEQIVTPAGIAKYPRLNKPETEVNGKALDKPRFTVGLVLDEKDAGVLAFKKKLEALQKEAVAVADKARLADPKRRKKPLVVNQVIKPVLDDDGNEVPGKFEIKAKTHAETKDGTPKTIRMFNSKGTPITAKVGGGSVLKLSVTPDAYDSNLGAGVSLYLNAVQVLELHEFSGGGNASGFGFGAEEGYEAVDSSEDAGDGASDSGESDEGAEDGSSEDETLPGDGASGKGDF